MNQRIPLNQQAQQNATQPAAPDKLAGFQVDPTKAQTIVDQQNKIKEEKAKERAKGAYRYRLDWKDGGQTSGNVIFLDESTRNGFSCFEHELTVNGNWKNRQYEVSPLYHPEYQEDPITTESGSYGDARFPTHVIYYTVLDLNPYTIKTGPRAGTTVPYSRRLFGIKQNYRAQFMDIMEKGEKKHGKLRGLQLFLKRTEKTGSVLGSPVLNDEAEMFVFHSEDHLIKTFGHEAITNDQGTVIKQANQDILAFDYLDVLSMKTPDQLRKYYNIGYRFGSEQEQNAVWGNDSQNAQAQSQNNPQESTEDIPF